MVGDPRFRGDDAIGGSGDDAIGGSGDDAVGGGGDSVQREWRLAERVWKNSTLGMVFLVESADFFRG